MVEAQNPVFTGMVAIVPIKSGGRVYTKGELIPGAENWRNLQSLVSKGQIAPAVVIPAAGVSYTKKEDKEIVSDKEVVLAETIENAAHEYLDKHCSEPASPESKLLSAMGLKPEEEPRKRGRPKGS